MFKTNLMLTPLEAAEKMFSDKTSKGRQKVYRMLQSNYLQQVGEINGCRVYKNGRRYLIPAAICKHLEKGGL